MRKGRRSVLVVLVAAAVLGLVACGSRKKDAPQPPRVTVADPLGEALAYAPVEAPALAVLSTDVEGGPIGRLRRLIGRLPFSSAVSGQLAGAIRAITEPSGRDDTGGLLGNPAVVWSDTLRLDRPSVAWVVTDSRALTRSITHRVESGTLTPNATVAGHQTWALDDGRAVAQKGPVLLFAPTRQALEATIARRAVPAAHWTPALVAQQSVGLPGGALAKLLAPATTLLAELPHRPDVPVTDATKVPYLAALRRAAIGAYPDDDGVRLRVRVTSDATTLTEDQLPLAPGPEPPAPQGAARLVIAARDPGRTIEWVRGALRVLDPDRLKGLDMAQSLLGKYADVDLGNDLFGQLNRNGTLTTNDFRTGTFLADPDDPDAVRSVLDRAGNISRLAGGLLGAVGIDLGGFSVDEQTGGTKVLKQDGKTLVSVAVKHDRLVASTVLGADLERIGAFPPPTPQGLPALGALRATLDRRDLQQRLTAALDLPTAAQRVLDPLGDPVLTLRTERDHTEAELLFPVS